MAMTQMQIIRALGEAMSWMEKELAWGVPSAELRHLNGRIGELYAALITNGQMVTEVNQHGYDVVSQRGERISVKTTTMSTGSGHISFNTNTLDQVDRIIILRVNTEEMQIETLLDAPVEQAISLMGPESGQGKRNIALSKLYKPTKPRQELATVRSKEFNRTTITELETGTIEVRIDDQIVPALPELRRIASHLNIAVHNDAGNPHNTRQLGSIILNVLES